MEMLMTQQEWCERNVRNHFNAIRIPATTRTNWKEFATAWMAKYGGTYHNAYSMWRVTYHEKHSQDLSTPYIPLD